MITLRDLVTRRMSHKVPSLLVTLASSAAVFLVALPLAMAEPWVPLENREVVLIATSSVFVLMGYSFSVLVMRVGEVGASAPFRYTGLVWALLLGWFAFGDWPDTLTILGALIVAMAGLFTLYRERLRE